MGTFDGSWLESDQIRSVPCSKCRANVGQPCRDGDQVREKKTKKRGLHHFERMQLAQQTIPKEQWHRSERLELDRAYRQALL